MRAVVITEPGGPEVLALTDVPDPSAGSGEVVIDVVAFGINRADLLQRQGHYPPPRGVPAWPGLEVSGRVAALGEGVTTWQVGDEVCALLSGGGYAEQVAVPATQLLPVPNDVGLVSAAALPEVACTVWSNLHDVAGLAAAETLLIHGGGSGIGTFAIQFAKASGVRVLVTCGSERKADACLALGADVAINYREQDFLEAVREVTEGRGVDVILDVIGAKYLSRNVDALASAGRLVIIGLQGGTRAELDLNAVMRKRASIHGTTLRARPASEKAAIVRGVREHVWPLIDEGKIHPVIHHVSSFNEVADAHRLMESGENIGKILVTAD